jgi:hypothetical protein
MLFFELQDETHACETLKVTLLEYENAFKKGIFDHNSYLQKLGQLKQGPSHCLDMLSKTTFATIVSIVYTLGYNDFGIFEKIKSSDPVVDAKLISRTRLQQFFLQQSKGIKKNADLDAAFEYIEKFGKSYWK